MAVWRRSEVGQVGFGGDLANVSPVAVVDDVVDHRFWACLVSDHGPGCCPCEHREAGCCWHGPDADPLVDGGVHDRHECRPRRRVPPLTAAPSR